MSAPVQRSSRRVPLLVGDSVDAFRRKVRAEALAEAIAAAGDVIGPLWHVDTVVEVEARLRRLADGAAEVADQGHDDAAELAAAVLVPLRDGDRIVVEQDATARMAAPDPVVPRAVSEASIGRAQLRARVGAFVGGVRWYRIAAEAGAIEL
ncbi:hypothetical protein ACGFWE_13735 [Streptomyces sp. NPDC048523]|uniref:hypothetical protein n=1 Tax=Streptomyces sp. NPDC048523 TaxID=3365567 RepID=UPI0037127357